MNKLYQIIYNESKKFESFKFESINNEYEHNSIESEIIIKEENIYEDSSLYNNFKDLMKRYNDFKEIITKINLRKRTRDNSTKEFLSHKRENNFLSLISKIFQTYILRCFNYLNLYNY